VNRRTRLAFLLVVLAQAAHSAEEYIGRLYDVFPPARFVSGLASSDPATGFLIVNLALVAFGLWCWAGPVRSRWPAAREIAWSWTVLELANGAGHSWLAFARRGYFPGVATSPLLLTSAAWLALELVRQAAPPVQPSSNGQPVESRT
jgi:Protein of unknown function with HXXEE motif